MQKAILLLSLFIATNASAQKVYLGISGGYFINCPIIENNNPLPQYLQETTSKVALNSFGWAFHLGYKVSDRLGIETQIQFTKERYKERVELLYHFQDGPIVGTKLAEIDRYISYHYTRIPLLVHYRFLPASSRLRIGILAGPSLGFSGRQSSRSVGVNELGREKAGTVDFWEKASKTTDIGFQLGCRIQANLNTNLSIFADGKIYQGFNNSWHDYDARYVYYENFVNRHFTATLGALFLLPKIPKSLVKR